MTTSSSQQLNKPVRQVVSARDSIDSILASVPLHRNIDQCKFSALQEEMQDVIVDDVQHVQDAYRRIPGPQTSAENEDPVNEQLLQDDQLDIEAARTLLGLPILNNAITVKHYWWIVKSLRQKLLEVGLIREVPCREAYARVLLRLVETLMTYSNQQDSISPYSRPREYVESLGMLLDDMAEGFIIKKQSGIEVDVYIKNMELHTDHLSSLASRLRGA